MFKFSLIFKLLFQSFSLLCLLVLSACSSSQHKESNEVASYGWELSGTRTPSNSSLPSSLTNAIGKFQTRYGLKAPVTRDTLDQAIEKETKACQIVDVCQDDGVSKARMREFLKILADEQEAQGKKSSELLTLKFENRFTQELSISQLAELL